MVIRIAVLSDLSRMMEIYDEARAFMRSVGNMNQWPVGYPSKDAIIRDIKEGYMNVCVDNEIVIGVFYYRIGDDPTYAKIYNGAWLNNEPYGVIHRIAISDIARGKGISSKCFDFCLSLCPNLKIDTHVDNAPMRKALLKNGFSYCGIIHLANGDERIAFQKHI